MWAQHTVLDRRFNSILINFVGQSKAAFVLANIILSVSRQRIVSRLLCFDKTIDGQDVLFQSKVLRIFVKANS